MRRHRRRTLEEEDGRRGAGGPERPRPTRTRTRPASRPSPATRRPADADVESIQDILVKQEARAEEEEAEEEDDVGPHPHAGERLEPLAVQVVPPSRPSSSARTATWSSTGASWRTRRGCSAGTAPERAALRLPVALLIALAGGLLCRSPCRPSGAGRSCSCAIPLLWLVRAAPGARAALWASRSGSLLRSAPVLDLPFGELAWAALMMSAGLRRACSGCCAGRVAPRAPRARRSGWRACGP